MIQKERILKYIKNFGSITSLEAFKELGITQLGVRVFELKNEGYEFLTKVEHGTNRYGEKIDYTRYYLKDDLIEYNMDHIPSIGGLL